MKYFTTPAAEDLNLEEAFTLVCLRERCDIAGIVRNITPLVESIYAKISKARWLEIITKLHDEHVLFYGKDTIVLSSPPFTYQNRNHAVAAIASIASLNPTILYKQEAVPVLRALITRIGTEAKGHPILIPPVLEGIARDAMRCHRDAIGMPSGCHQDAMPMHPHLNNINFNFNFKFNSSSPLTPQENPGGHRMPSGKEAGGKPPAPPRRRKEEDSGKGSPGGQAPQTPPDKADWNGVLLSEAEAAKLMKKYPNLDLIDLTQEVADYYETKGEPIKHPFQACVKWAENKEAK